jgi:hypothetical protein
VKIDGVVTNDEEKALKRIMNLGTHTELKNKAEDLSKTNRTISVPLDQATIEDALENLNELIVSAVKGLILSKL